MVWCVRCSLVEVFTCGVVCEVFTCSTCGVCEVFTCSTCGLVCVRCSLVQLVVWCV